MIKKHQEKTRFLLGLCCIVMSCVLLNQVYEPEKDRHAVYLLANENIGDTEEPVSLYSKNALLIRLSDHQVLWESGSKEMIYPASMTKMMTAILAIEAVDDLNTQVTLPSDIFAPIKTGECLHGRFSSGRDGHGERSFIRNTAAFRGRSGSDAGFICERQRGGICGADE